VTSIAIGRIMAEVDGDGEPILFVHGLGASSNSFQALLGSLGGFRCIRPDLPGSARSVLGVETLSIGIFADAVCHVAKTLGAVPAHLVGHSMGTLVCQHVAARMPEAVRSMTLFGPILEPPEVARQRLRDRARSARQDGMAAIADAVAAAGLSSASKSANPIALPFLRECHMRQDPEGFAQSCEALAEAEAADLRLVRCPTLLVTGEEDGVGPPSMAQAIADRIKGARVKVLERCGHWTPVERPADCARLLSEFVRSAGSH
jgi:pimeloyl-ACP methyl ester carboxylesterase